MEGWHQTHWDENNQDDDRNPDAGAGDMKDEVPAQALLGQHKNMCPTGGYQEHTCCLAVPSEGPRFREQCARD